MSLQDDDGLEVLKVTESETERQSVVEREQPDLITSDQDDVSMPALRAIYDGMGEYLRGGCSWEEWKMEMCRDPRLRREMMICLWIKEAFLEYERTVGKLGTTKAQRVLYLLEVGSYSRDRPVLPPGMKLSARDDKLYRRLKQILDRVAVEWLKAI